MEFFVILKTEPGTRLRRLAMSAEAQASATTLFEAQFDFFNSGIEQAVAYAPNYTPEDHEILEITGFDDEEGILEGINNPLGVQAFDIGHDDIAKVCGIFGAQVVNDEPMALLQVFDRRRSLQTGGLWLVHRQGTFTTLQDPGLTFDSALVATLQPGILRFRSFHLVRRLFDVDSYFKEATNPELEAFANHNVIQTPAGLNLIEIADTPIRRKVGLIAASKILDNVPVADLVRVAGTLNIELNVVKKGGVDAFVLPTDKAELKRVLSYLNEDFWKSPLTDTMFYSSSKRPV